jgi:hypothetical protein
MIEPKTIETQKVYTVYKSLDKHYFAAFLNLATKNYENVLRSRSLVHDKN